MLRHWFFMSLDRDGKRLVADVYKEVNKRASMFYDLVIACKEEGKYDFTNALEVY